MRVRFTFTGELSLTDLTIRGIAGLIFRDTASYSFLEDRSLCCFSGWIRL